MEIDDWRDRCVTAWPKRKEIIEGIVDLCIDPAYKMPDKPRGLIKKLKTLECDHGLLIIWKRNKTDYRRLIYSNNGQMYDRAIDRLPHGMATDFDKLAEIMEAEARGQDKRHDSLLNRYLDNGPIAVARREREEEDARAARREEKRLKKKKKSK